MSKEIKELQRIRSILSCVTGFEDDDKKNIEDARKSVGKVIDSLADQPAPVQHFDHTSAANAALRDAQNRSYQVAKCKYPKCSYPCPYLPDCRDAEKPEQRKPLTDEQVNLFINGRGDEDDENYVEPTGDGYGITESDLVKLVRRVEEAHGIKSKKSKVRQAK